jgi:hypothetical protein
MRILLSAAVLLLGLALGHCMRPVDPYAVRRVTLPPVQPEPYVCWHPGMTPLPGIAETCPDDGPVDLPRYTPAEPKLVPL